MIKYFCDRCGKEIDGKVNEYTDTTEAINHHTQKVVATWKTVEHICDECEQKELVCGFKVGDEVITSTGEVGVITSICTCDRCKERGFYEPTVDFGDYTDCIMISDKNNGFKSYYKIGDRVFGNINEESVNKELEEIGERYNKLVKQQSIINLLKAKKENNNGN
jgi:hypothetical protein